MSGHHGNVEKWRLEQSIERTKERRPDLYEKYVASLPPVPEKKKKRGKKMKRIDLLDLHTHTIASGHAYSTIREMTAAGKEKGLSVMAITEHAPSVPNSCGQIYFRNLRILDRTGYDIPVLFGTEVNLLNKNGEIDLNEYVLEQMDLVIASMHPPIFQVGTKEENTQAVLKVMDNPYVAIIGHPDDGRIELDYEPIIQKAKEKKVLIEINNASLKPGAFRPNAKENDTTILKLCDKYRVPVVLDSDAHVDKDVRDHEYAWRLAEELHFPHELIVNTNPAMLKEYLRPAGLSKWQLFEEKGLL